MHKLLSVSIVAIVMASASITSAQDATAKSGKLESNAKERTPANTIDFNAQLQVPLQALSHLGQMIEEAREEADPICIASAANILAAAESLAGDKRAKLTSSELWDEAIKLAEMRYSSAELLALAAMAGGDKATSLREMSESAKADEDAAKAAEEAGETSRDLNGSLHVSNRSHEYVRIYVDGRYVGGLAPHGSTEVHLHHAHTLEARSHDHRWDEHIEGDRHHYDWVIRDPHHPH